MAESWKGLLTRLYTGRGQTAVRFRYFLIAFDAVTILFFIITAPMPATPDLTLITRLIGLVVLADFLSRLWIAPNKVNLVLKIYSLADIVVIASIFLDPFVAHSLAFLRILRGLRLIHSYHLLSDLRRDSKFFRLHEDAVIASINLLVFVFVTASAVFALFFDKADGPAAYIDALYFTVATLTTTGFGDITMTTSGGKLFAVFVMVVGVALFVQLARAIFQPAKVRHTCPECGLMRHDLDAVHCKHCGVVLKIETQGQE